MDYMENSSGVVQRYSVAREGLKLYEATLQRDTIEQLIGLNVFFTSNSENLRVRYGCSLSQYDSSRLLFDAIVSEYAMQASAHPP